GGFACPPAKKRPVLTKVLAQRLKSRCDYRTLPPFMHISHFIARTITQRRALVWTSVALLTVVCIAILVTSLQLDSEIFNVFPGKFWSVQGLKIYDRDFEQTRELTFALQCDPKDVDKLDEFAPVFAERLR